MGQGGGKPQGDAPQSGPPRRLIALLFVALLCHLLFQTLPAWTVIRSAPNGRDFASYYYALQVAWDGGDPYDGAALTARAHAEHTRRSVVHPYFYPPPFLLSMAWARPLTLVTAYRLSLLFNELLLVAGCALLRRFGAGWGWIAALVVVYSPIPDNMWMGQANLLALIPALAGLWLSRTRGREVAGGVLIGVAGMLKMSPALFLVPMARWGRWRAVGAGVATAIALSVLALPLVPFAVQWRFYTEILPGFASGDYNGLTVPISLNANHSVPDLLHRAFPSGRDTLSQTAQAFSKAAMLGALGGWWWWFRAPQQPGEAGLSADQRALAEGLALGALSVWMVCLPVYTYEHHLVFLLLALASVGTAAQARAQQQAPGSGGRAWLAAAVLLFVVLALPLEWSRAVQDAAGGLSPWLAVAVRESKFIGEAALLAGCMAGYRWISRRIR